MVESEILDFFTKCGGKSSDGVPSFDQFRLMRYATRVWLLQERGRFSYFHARLYLRREWPNTLEDLSKRMEWSIESLQKEAVRVDKLVEEELKHTDIFLGHDPVYPEDEARYSGKN